MAELFTEDGTYRNVPVYDNFEYIANNKYDGWTTLSPVWTTSGLLMEVVMKNLIIIIRRIKDGYC